MQNPRFVINAMKELNRKYFVIEDAGGHTMYHNWQNIPLEQSIKRFKEFVDSCSGNSSFIVYLFESNDRLKNGEPKATNHGMRYEVFVTDMQEEDGILRRGMQGTEDAGAFDMAQQMYRAGSMGSIGLDQYLGATDEIMTLRLRIQQLEMDNKYLEDKYTSEIEKLKKEHEAEKSSEKKIEGIIGSVLPAMGLGGNGMAGITGLTEEVMEQKSTKQQVIEAVNILLQHDVDFVTNIQKLSKLAQSNPQIYKVAVEQLNKLG